METISIKKNKFLEFFFIACIFFVLLVAFWNNGYAYPDSEEEIYIKGQQIAQGLFLYKDIACQHMPLMYFIAAFFCYMGVTTITGFRLCFYALMALIWSGTYMYYKDVFGRKVMVLYPIVYMGAIVTMYGGTCILCEQFQGQGEAILFFALLKFAEDFEIKLKDCIIISFAIFISFGNAFVAIFAIFFVALTVLVLEIRKCRNEQLSFFEIVIYLAEKYIVLFIMIAIPWIVLLLYFVYTKTLYAFYSWA